MSAPVQSRPVKQQAPSTTIADAFSSSTPAGNLVVAVISQQNAGAPIRAITSVADSVDGANLSYVIGIQDGVPNARIDIYSRKATSSGTRTVTCTFTGGSAEASLCIIEFDSTYTLADAVNAATGTSATANPGSVTPSKTAIYINAVDPSNLSSGGITEDGAYTLIQEAENSGTSAPLSVSYREGTGASNPSTTFNSSPWANAIATFVSPDATATTLSGPTVGMVGLPIPYVIGADGAITGTVTVTPSDGGAGGSFNPATVDISSGSPTGTTNYTNNATGSCTISTTNNGGLSNPASISLLRVVNLIMTALTSGLRF